MVDFLQEQISSVASSISITQTSSILSPLQNALQSAVSLHALCTLHQGLESDRESIQCMLDYLHEMTQNESYLQVLPESILSFFNSLESTLYSLIHSSIESSLSSSHTTLPPQSIHSSMSLGPSNPPLDSSSSDPSSPIQTVILVDDGLVQQHHLIQYSFHSLSSLSELSNLRTFPSFFAISTAYRWSQTSHPPFSYSTKQRSIPLPSNTQSTHSLIPFNAILAFSFSSMWNTPKSIHSPDLSNISSLPFSSSLPTSHFPSSTPLFHPFIPLSHHVARLPIAIRRFLDQSPLLQTDWKVPIFLPCFFS